MTRKHFKAIAEALISARRQSIAAARTTAMHVGGNPSHAEAYAEAVANRHAVEVADACAEHNGRFDRARFLAAAGAES